MNIEQIRALCGTDHVVWSAHCLKRLQQRSIRIADVEYAMANGEIIEDYPTDFPFPSCLVFGITRAGQTLHVVCAVGEGSLFVITAYRPDLDHWEADLKTRKENPS